jgi:hypothetical protein
MFFDPLSQSQSMQAAYPTVQETIPRSSLGYASNNLYAGFPPLMNDGRSISAAFQPEAVKNRELLQNAGIKSNWQYRKYLTENSREIAEQNFKEACNDTGYTQRFTPNEREYQKPITNTPFVYPSYLDGSQPIGYSNSDLKDLYLTREQLNARRQSPAITQEELIKTLNFN